ncbi:MAG: 23S rRNA (uracil(1939)-C(5))-methyltransferase RlmD [Eubacteriales bacterium]
MEKNQIFTEVRIEDIGNLGYGICHIEGKTVFVHGGVDGDLADLKIIKDARDYAVARVERLIEPSPCRTDPICPHFGRCGGCVYRQIDYAHELELKTRYVVNALRKAGVEVPSVRKILSDRPDGYRNKVQYPIGEGGTVGYYAPKSHRVIPSENCLLQDPAFTPVVKDCADYFAAHHISVYNETTGKGLLRHLCLRTASAECGGQISLCIVINGDKLPDEAGFCREITEKHPNIASICLSVNKKQTNVILGEHFRLIYGSETITDRLCGLDFAISAASFYQVNRNMAEKLYERAAEYADLKDGQTVVDLFCGVGTVGLSVVKDHPNCRLVGVEIVPQAVENARVNARRNKVENAAFYQGDANHPAIEQADVVLIDPPRKGCEESLISRIAEIAPDRVVYISCNPDTLARDCARFRQAGYAVTEVTPADLFPRTGHVETVVLLERKE